ncbi:unnamed protein product, partial [Ectocarpus fasciculatus]
MKEGSVEPPAGARAVRHTRCIHCYGSMSLTAIAQDDGYWGKETFACFL